MCRNQSVMSNRLKWLVILLSVSVFRVNAAAPARFSVSGAVVAADSREPVAGAVVTVEGSGLWAVADRNGEFVIGYQPRIRLEDGRAVWYDEAAGQMTEGPLPDPFSPEQAAEGIQLLDAPAFSVQYHPEAATCPTDAHYLFTAFMRLMDGDRDYLDIDIAKDRLAGWTFAEEPVA